MPRPPVMPLAYGSTGFRLSVQAPSKILAVLKDAGADLTTIPEKEIEDRLNDAVVSFLDARVHAVRQKPFREEVKALRADLTKFSSALPDDYSALASSLAKYWRYGGRLTLSPAANNASNVIGFQTPIAHLRGELLRFSEALNALAEEARVGKAGRTEALEDHEYVDALSSLYTAWTNRKPTQGIHVAGSNQNERSRGQFPEFLRAIDGAICGQMFARLQKGTVIKGEERPGLTSAQAEEAVKPFRLLNLETLVGSKRRKQSTRKKG